MRPLRSAKARINAIPAMARRYRHERSDNFFFIHINKTGGTSIQRALSLPPGHMTAKERIERCGREEWERRFCFTVVRNPWSKVVSHYHYRQRRGLIGLADSQITFNEWVRAAYEDHDPFVLHGPRKMFMPQLDWLTDAEGHILVDFVCRFERLEEDFSTVANRIGRPARLPHLNSTQHRHYSTYYDDLSIETIRRSFASDIETFGYEYAAAPNDIRE